MHMSLVFGDEFLAQGLHLKSHLKCSAGIRTWLSADQFPYVNKGKPISSQLILKYSYLYKYFFYFFTNPRFVLLIHDSNSNFVLFSLHDRH